jgi:hypothetical protein
MQQSNLQATSLRQKIQSPAIRLHLNLKADSPAPFFLHQKCENTICTQAENMLSKMQMKTMVSSSERHSSHIKQWQSR